MKTTYKIHEVTNKTTVVHEYWDDLQIFSYFVYDVYRGGNIEEFLIENYVTRNPNFVSLMEYHKRMNILDSF